MQEKRKPSGLSKKIPSIFKGLPNLDGPVDPGAETRDTGGGKAPAKPAGTVSGRGLRFLFEIGEVAARAIVSRAEDGDWKPLKVQKFRYAVDKQGQAKKNAADLQAWLTSVIKDFAAKEDYEIRILLMTHGIFMTEMDKPGVESKGMEEAIVWAIAEELPFPVEESRVVYEERASSVLVSAVESESVEATLATLHQAGIYPSLITLLPVGMESLHRQKQVFKSKNLMVINISEERTNLIVFREGEFHALRDVSIGSEHVTRAMMGTLVVDNSQITIQYEEASALRDAIGLPTPDLMPDQREPKLSQLSVRVRPLFEKMINEVRTSIIQFQKTFENETVEEIYLIGDGSDIKGVETYFYEQIQIPVERLGLEESDPDLTADYTALAGLNYADESRFNFGTTEDLWKPRLEKWCDYLKKGSLALAAVFVIAFVLTVIQIAAATVRIKLTENKISQMGPAAQKLKEIESLAKEVKSREEIFMKTVGPMPYLGAVLRELSRIIPPSMALKNMTYNRTTQIATMNFTGLVRQSNRPPDLVLSDFLKKLNESAFFQYSNLASRSSSGEGDGDDDDAAPRGEAGPLRFTITTQLVNPGE